MQRIVGLGGAPAGWDSQPPSFSPESDKPIATRAASGKTIQWVAAGVPELVGGSADLASSNNTDIADGGDVTTDEFAGRNLHFGVREHAMGAIVNGLALHGFRAYGGTFLTFSDYMRGAVRLSALMHLPAVWVWTHDSIGLGSDGPTHQPVEHLAALRAMPNLSVIRPADANETVLAWRHAVSAMDHPSALVLSRQDLPILEPASVPADAVERGAYVLRDAGEGEPDVILIATGSELQIALAAAEGLAGEDVKVRVVSMPCMDHFAAQPNEYRDQVLPPAVRARVSIEAAATLGWHRWVGDLGEVIGMSSFGASGTIEELYPHFGFTPERVAEAARAAIKRAAVENERTRTDQMSTLADVNPQTEGTHRRRGGVWLDQLGRSLVAGGELKRMVEEESLHGVTSNPSIFEKSILGTADYDEAIEELARANKSAKEIYDTLAVADVQAAADVLAVVHEQTGGRDGFVSLEVAPDLARDTDGTIEAARTYWKAVDRPNVMIKIPGTPEGVSAIETAIYEGINVNVTLLFSVDAYAQVADAYIRGLERRLAEGKSLDVHSVASFFVSRVDSLVDKQLEAIGGEAVKLSGKAALANARAAYLRFMEIFSGERWDKLAAAGAAVQRPLWASTGVKNPAYPDTMYVDELMPLTPSTRCRWRRSTRPPTMEIDPRAPPPGSIRSLISPRWTAPGLTWTRSQTSCWGRASGCLRTRWTRCSTASPTAARPSSPHVRRRSTRACRPSSRPQRPPASSRPSPRTSLSASGSTIRRSGVAQAYRRLRTASAGSTSRRRWLRTSPT